LIFEGWGVPQGFGWHFHKICTILYS
jgi:hypothetical protein